MMDNYSYKKIMIVDDSALDRHISKIIIEKNAFAGKVLVFDTVPHALLHLSAIDVLDEFPELILLDINMPIMDGFDFLDHYTMFPDFVKKYCNIIMISSTKSSEDLTRIKKYPFVRFFFKKPLSEKILNNIREHIGDKVLS